MKGPAPSDAVVLDGSGPTKADPSISDDNLPSEALIAMRTTRTWAERGRIVERIYRALADSVQAAPGAGRRKVRLPEGVLDATDTVIHQAMCSPGVRHPRAVYRV